MEPLRSHQPSRNETLAHRSGSLEPERLDGLDGLDWMDGYGMAAAAAPAEFEWSEVLPPFPTLPTYLPTYLSPHAGGEGTDLEPANGRLYR